MTASIDSGTHSLTERIRTLRDTLLEGLVERDEAIRMALLAALAGEHLLLLGPPGTAKSLVARRLHLAFTDATYFERLLTRFTVPEELFGPLSIKGLEQDRYERLTDAYLPSASIAFLDEIFKANSAILNALLTLLNEREFDNGTRRVRTPLVAVVGASNELPEPGELDALFDRFLLRVHVEPVSAQSFPALLGLQGNAVPQVAPELRLSQADLAGVQQLAELVELPEDVMALLCELRDWCTAQNLRVSDRRWRKAVKLLQVSAFTNGGDRVSVWDCWLLQHCLGSEREDRQKIYDWYAARVGASAAMDPSRLTRIVTAWEGQLKADRESRQQMRNERGQLLFKTGSDELTVQQQVQKKRNKAPLYLAPENSFKGQRGWSHESIKDRTNEGKGYTREDLNALQIGDVYQAVSFQHWPDAAAYLADESNWLMDSDLRPATEPTRHKPVYVADSIRELDKVRADVEAYHGKLLSHMESLREQIRTHLWIPAGFAQPALESLERTRHQVEVLLARIVELRKGFDRLPREREAPAPTEAAADEMAAPAPSPGAEAAA